MQCVSHYVITNHSVLIVLPCVYLYEFLITAIIRVVLSADKYSDCQVIVDKFLQPQMSAMKTRPRRTPKVPLKVRSSIILDGESNDSVDTVYRPLSNGYEDISSDSEGSFDAAEFEEGEELRNQTKCNE